MSEHGHYVYSFIARNSILKTHFTTIISFFLGSKLLVMGFDWISVSSMNSLLWSRPQIQSESNWLPHGQLTPACWVRSVVPRSTASRTADAISPSAAFTAPSRVMWAGQLDDTASSVPAWFQYALQPQHAVSSAYVGTLHFLWLNIFVLCINFRWHIQGHLPGIHPLLFLLFIYQVTARMPFLSCESWEEIGGKKEYESSEHGVQ